MPTHEETTPVRLPKVIIDRIRPIVAYRMKNTIYSRLHTLDPEYEPAPSLTAVLSEAIEYYADLCAPIESTPADRLVDPEGNLDFRFVPWSGNTPTPEMRKDFQQSLHNFIHEVWKDYVPSVGAFTKRKKKK